MKTKSFLLAIIIVNLLIGCKNPISDEQQKCRCPMFDVVTMSPYEDPVCHPSGKFVGFNYKPIKQIKYTYGYDCPRQASYKYAEDSVGFWLVNTDGTHQRRILPYKLECPAWSPDGKWIAFSSGAQICIMPFDGERFDTAAVQVLTKDGRNFFPSWSPDGKILAYDSNAESLKGQYFIWTIDINNSWKKRIVYTPDLGEVRFPNYTLSNKILHYRYMSVDKGGGGIFIMKPDGNDNARLTTNTEIIKEIKSSFDNRYIAYISSLSTGGVYLFRMDADGNNLIKLTEEFTMQFSWLPDGRIVYLKHDDSRLDKTKGTLWIMNADGSGKKPLTFNNPKIIY